MQLTYDLRQRQLLEADLPHYDPQSIDQLRALRHRYVGTWLRRRVPLSESVHLGDLNVEILRDHLGLEGRLGGVGQSQPAELLDLHALPLLLELPPAILLAASIQIIVVVRMACTRLAFASFPILDLLFEPGSSDVELVARLRGLPTLELCLPGL